MATVKVACPACGKRYKVAEEQLQRRTVCKECGHQFLLADARVQEDTERGGASAQPQWYVELRGKQSGPFDGDKVLELIEDGQITGGTLVWREGMENWQPLKLVPEFASAIPIAAYDAQELGRSGARVEAGVERGPLVSPEQFARAFRGAFDFKEGRIPERLKEYIGPDERVTMAFSLSGVALFISVVSVCIIPLLLSLLGLFASAILGRIVGGAALLLLITTIIAGTVVYLSWLNTGYVLTDRRLLGRRGIFNVRWVFLSRSLINSVEINTGLLDRLVGTETITVKAFTDYVRARGVSSDVSRRLMMLIIPEHPKESGWPAESK